MGVTVWNVRGHSGKADPAQLYTSSRSYLPAHLRLSSSDRMLIIVPHRHRSTAPTRRLLQPLPVQPMRNEVGKGDGMGAGAVASGLSWRGRRAVAQAVRETSLSVLEQSQLV